MEQMYRVECHICGGWRVMGVYELDVARKAAAFARLGTDHADDDVRIVNDDTGEVAALVAALDELEAHFNGKG